VCSYLVMWSRREGEGPEGTPSPTRKACASMRPIERSSTGSPPGNGGTDNGIRGAAVCTVSDSAPARFGFYCEE